MYFYCISYGEYEQYSETIFFHEKQFTQEEFDMLVKESEMSEEDLCENHGFKKVQLHAHYHED